MKAAQTWRLNMKDMQILPAHRHRSHLKKPTWIIVLVSLVSVFLICAYIYPPHNSAACYVFSSNGCNGFPHWLPPAPAREFTDDEVAARVVIRDILNAPPVQLKNPKIAFLFLTPGALPFEKLWDMFFQGHEGRFSVYVHASKDKPVHFSRYFINREIRSDKVVWGKISMVDAERRLLANALKDPDNQHFVLLSDSCIPLHDFDYVFNYLMYTNISFVDCFEDPGPHGSGRYSEHMLPEVEKNDFRKGAQWFTMKRQHAIIVMADNLYYSKFRDYCKLCYIDSGTDVKDTKAMLYQPTCLLVVGSPSFCINAWFAQIRFGTGQCSFNVNPSLFCKPVEDLCVIANMPGMDGRNCYSDEHYLPTFFHMLDPDGISNWSVTNVDWSEGKWHPKSYKAQDISYELLKNISAIDESVHVTSDERKEVQVRPCLWNGMRRPCYLFARKFLPETLDNLMQLFSNYTMM